MANRYTRDYRDYLIEIGDRVQFHAEGMIMTGTVSGRGAAGNYLRISGDDGGDYEAYSSDSDLHKLFPEDDGYHK